MIRLRLGALLLCVFALSNCGRPNDDEMSLEERSRKSWAQGMLAMDEGDEAAAETHLKRAIAQDPTHAGPRIALASIYSQRAGLRLNHWIDHFVFATETLERHYAVMLAMGQPAHSSLTQSVLGLGALLNAFVHLPDLISEHSAHLDQAIEVLRSPEPGTLTEEVRSYLSILGAIRIVQSLRKLLADGKRLSLEKLNTLTNEEIRDGFRRIRADLNLLEESTYVAPQFRTDPTPARRARLELGNLIRTLNSHPLWYDILSTTSDATTRLEKEFMSLRFWLARRAELPPVPSL